MSTEAGWKLTCIRCGLPRAVILGCDCPTMDTFNPTVLSIDLKESLAASEKVRREVAAKVRYEAEGLELAALEGTYIMTREAQSMAAALKDCAKLLEGLEAQANVEEKKAAFLEAAMRYCHLWTRDHRNTHATGRVGHELEKARGNLYDAYRALVEAERKEAKAHPQEVAMVTCENCGEWTPPAFACIRCGLTREKVRIGEAERESASKKEDAGT